MNLARTKGQVCILPVGSQPEDPVFIISCKAFCDGSTVQMNKREKEQQTCTEGLLLLFPFLSAACKQGTAPPGLYTDDQAYVSNEPDKKPSSSLAVQYVLCLVAPVPSHDFQKRKLVHALSSISTCLACHDPCAEAGHCCSQPDSRAPELAPSFPLPKHVIQKASIGTCPPPPPRTRVRKDGFSV